MNSESVIYLMGGLSKSKFGETMLQPTYLPIGRRGPHPTLVRLSQSEPLTRAKTLSTLRVGLMRPIINE